MGNSHFHSHRKYRVQTSSSSSPLPVPSNPNYLYPPPPPPHFYPQPQSSSSMAITLPYSHVDSCLRALAGQAQGFGRHAIGGYHGPLFHVTSLAGFISILPPFFSIVEFLCILIWVLFLLGDYGFFCMILFILQL